MPHTPDALSVTFTRHAEARIRQRGVRSEVVDLVLTHHDREANAGAGVVAISVSRHRCRELQNELAEVRLLDQVKRTVLLIAEDGSVVSVINRPTWFMRFHRGAERLNHRRRRGQRARNRQ